MLSQLDSPTVALPEPAAPGERAWATVTGGALSIVAALSLGFVGQLSLLGTLQHARTQSVTYDSLRKDLATATVPVGPRDQDGDLLAPGTPIALLEAPTIGLREVVAEGTAGGVLAAGPGHRRDTVFPGQAGTSVLLGRRAAYGGPFARIAELRRGDRIQVTTGQGRHSFQVLGVRHAGDPEPAARVGQGRLTLVTADGPAYVPKEVLRVDAVLTTPVQPTPPPAVTAAALPAADRPMASDDSALIVGVLWTQLLVAAAFGVVWLRHRAGRWHAWLVGVPVLGALGTVVADHAARLLPNLL